MGKREKGGKGVQDICSGSSLTFFALGSPKDTSGATAGVLGAEAEAAL